MIGVENLKKKIGRIKMKIKYYLCGNEKPISQYPLGLGYLLSNAKGYEAEIVEKPGDLRGADMIGLSTLTDGLVEAVEVAVMFHNYPIIVGGQGTLWPGITQQQVIVAGGIGIRPVFDLVVRGEGEDMVWSIVNKENWDEIKPPNFSFGEKVSVLPMYPNRIDIDTLVPPERGRCKDIVPILTSRGCPHNCSFCSSQKFWGKPRYHSAGYVIDEVEYLGKRYPHCCKMRIMDDSFISHKVRFQELYNRWMTKNLNRRWRLQGFVRSSDMNEHVATRLKMMGFDSVRFGAETASPRLLASLGKTCTVEDHQRCIDVCNEVDLHVTMSLMQYVPGETVEDRQLTAKFLQKNKDKVALGGNYRFRPYPGTKYYAGEDVLSGDWRARGAKKVQKNT